MREVSEKPASLLASIFSREEKIPELALVTGESGSGKTTWCLGLIDEARLRGIGVSGVVSPPVMEAGQKTGIDLMDACTSERRRLAMFRQDARQELANRPGLATGNWIFDPAAFVWGNHILGELEESDLLVLDELGPLELLENKGLTVGLRCIEARRYQLAVVVIRPSLLPSALERWPWGKILRVTSLSTKGASE